MKKLIFTRCLLLCVYSLVLMLGMFAPAQGFVFQQGYLEPVISRANRPGQIYAIIQNSGSVAVTNVTLKLQLPTGAGGINNSVGLTSNVPTWIAGQTQQFEWDVQSSTVTNGLALLSLSQGSKTLLSTNFPVWWQNSLTITNQNYVPAPVVAGTGRYQIGAIICPFWRDTGFSSIYGYPDRKPALGYYDEGDFEATDWQVKWALEHGISFFAACWYRNPNNVGMSPVVPQHQRWLEGGFLNGRYGSQAKFAIMSVGNIVNSQGDLVTNVFPYWLQNYFTQTNYLVLDNKPVVYFFSIPLANSVMSNALVQIRAQCVQAGFAGLYAIGCYNGFTSAGPYTNNLNLAQAGMDYSYAYHLPTFMNIFSTQHPTDAQAVAGHQTCWTAQEAGVIPNLVTVSSGWDSQPWGYSSSSIQWRLTPTDYKTLLQDAKIALDSRSGSGLDTKLLLLDDWNEYGEGHYFGVTRQFGFGYLDDVFQVFATNTSAPLDLGPQDIGRGTPYLDGQDRGYEIQANVNVVNVAVGGTSSFSIILSAAPTNNIIVTNILSLGVTNVAITAGAQLIFTPANWSAPQTVTLTAAAPTVPLQNVCCFSTAGGGSGYADAWVQVNVYSNSTVSPVTGAWNVDANGNWSSGANWLGGLIPSGLNGSAYFTNTISTSRTVTADLNPGGISNLVFGLAGVNNWTLSGTAVQLAPGAQVAVNRNTATISNLLVGNSSLTKNGVGVLVLSAANSYVGGTLIQAGTLQAANANALGISQVTVGSGAALDCNGNHLPVDAYISGSGAIGNGALVNTSGTGAGVQNLTLTGDATVRDVYGGLSASGLVAGGGHTLTVLGNVANGYFSLGNGQSSLGDIKVLSGSFTANGYLGNTTGCLGVPTNTITISGSGSLSFVANGSAVHNKNIVLNGGTIAEGQGGSPTLIGPVTLNTSGTMDVGDTLTMSGAIGGVAGFLKTGTGTLILAGANTYSGPTSFSGGSVQVANPLALQNSTANYSTGTLNFSVTAATLGGLTGGYNLALTNMGGGTLALAVGQNNGSNTYSGVLSGTGSLTKTGTGTLILTATNTYTGGTFVPSGFLKAGAASAFGPNTATVLNNGTLDTYGNRLVCNVAAAGAGADGNGAVVNSSGSQAGIQNLLLTGNTIVRDIFAGLNVFGPVTGGGYSLTVLGNGTAGYIGVGNGASDLGDINIVSGGFYANGYLPPVAGCLGRAANTLTVSASGTLGFPLNGTAVHNKPIVLNGGTIKEWLGGSPTLIGPVTLNSNSTFDVSDTLTIAGAISGSGGVFKISPGTLVLNAANSYTGNTVVGMGTLQLSGTGSISYSSVILVSNQATLNAVSVPGGLVVANKQTLSGNGTVTGNLMVAGILAPGFAPGSLSQLTNNGTATLVGTTLMQVGKFAGVVSNDFFAVSGSLNYGGSLVVSNIGVSGFTAGDTFTFFGATGYTGAFSSLTLPPLPAGLAWTNQLALNGSIAVVPSVLTTPVNLMFAVFGSSMQLSWPADHIGWRLQIQTNSVGFGLGTNWSDVMGSTTTNFVAVPIDPSIADLFLRLIYP